MLNEYEEKLINSTETIENIIFDLRSVANHTSSAVEKDLMDKLNEK